MLIDDGTDSRWLESDEWSNATLWILRSVNREMPDDLVGSWILTRHAMTSGDSAISPACRGVPRTSPILSLNSAFNWHDTVSCGSTMIGRSCLRADCCHCWRPSCPSAPEGMPQNYADHTRFRQTRLTSWSDGAFEALLEAARKMPENVWAVLFPHICRLAPRGDTASQASEFWLDGDHHGRGHGTECIPHGLVQLAIESGRRLAGQNGVAFWNGTETYRSHESPVIQCVLVEVYTGLPGEIADEALQWLVEDTTRLCTGTGNYEPEWMPAARLVEAMSPQCSIGVFHQLEEVIAHYHSPNERRRAEYCLSAWKTGYFDDYWGRAQHFLLPAPCAGAETTRRSA